jgi:hypothetical protein|eukprot:COSAG06_NODE_582_length_14006_cov_13.658661_7_plen_196_part_00
MPAVRRSRRKSTAPSTYDPDEEASKPQFASIADAGKAPLPEVVEDVAAPTRKAAPKKKKATPKKSPSRSPSPAPKRKSRSPSPAPAPEPEEPAKVAAVELELAEEEEEIPPENNKMLELLLIMIVVAVLMYYGASLPPPPPCRACACSIDSSRACSRSPLLAGGQYLNAELEAAAGALAEESPPSPPSPPTDSDP